MTTSRVKKAIIDQLSKTNLQRETIIVSSSMGGATEAGRAYHFVYDNSTDTPNVYEKPEEEILNHIDEIRSGTAKGIGDPRRVFLTSHIRHTGNSDTTSPSKAPLPEHKSHRNDTINVRTYSKEGEGQLNQNGTYTPFFVYDISKRRTDVATIAVEPTIHTPLLTPSGERKSS